MPVLSTGGLDIAQVLPPGATLTSRSLSLAGDNFSLDFSWQKLENPPPGRSETSALAPGRAARPASRGLPTVKVPERPPAFREVLRRHQLMGLLAEPSIPPTWWEDLPAATAPLPPTFAVAGRAYREGGAGYPWIAEAVDEVV
ncbi:MAG: hypothetical protein KQJ78_00325 [Deltaproteobacteria bacterium]|nr:hypothetical protein [Deltaproteobacteria bacterium]